MNRRQA